MTRMLIKVAESVYKFWVTTDQWTSEALSEEGAKRGTRRSTKCGIIPSRVGHMSSEFRLTKKMKHECYLAITISSSAILSKSCSL